jgi:hypothetical protein
VAWGSSIILMDLFFVILGALSIVIAALVLYLGWLSYQLCKAAKSTLRPPKVARDGNGRPLKERL